MQILVAFYHFCLLKVVANDASNSNVSTIDTKDLSKYWIVYPECFLKVKLEKSSSFSPELQILSCLPYLKTSCEAFKKIVVDRIHLEPKSTKCDHVAQYSTFSPISTIMLSPKELEKCTSEFDDILQIFTLIFKVHHKLRLNITFRDINLLDFNGKCILNYLRIKVDKHKEFLFCGTHSSFSLYSLSNTVNFLAKLGEIHISAFHSDITVLSRCVITNELIHPANYSTMQPLFVQTVHQRNITIYRFKLTVDKYMYIVLRVRVENGQHVTCYDGPGYKSNKHTLSKGNYNLTFASFQCLMIQTSQNIPKSQKQDKFVSYHGKQRDLVQLDIKSNNTRKLKYPEDNVFTSRQNCAYSLVSQKHSILSITLNGMYFSGPVSRECAFGGGSLFEFSHNHVKEIFAFCRRYDIHFLYSGRTIFLNTSKALDSTCSVCSQRILHCVIIYHNFLHQL